MEQKYDKCVSCGKDSKELESTDINYRHFYIEGAGQLCEECYNNLYDNF